jgi:hypothetical protein
MNCLFALGFRLFDSVTFGGFCAPPAGGTGQVLRGRLQRGPQRSPFRRRERHGSFNLIPDGY